MRDTMQRYSLAFAKEKPTSAELDALEASIDDQMYCGNDVLALIREIRRMRYTVSAALGLTSKVLETVREEIT